MALSALGAAVAVAAAWDARRSLRFAFRLREADAKIMQAQERYLATMSDLAAQLNQLHKDFVRAKERCPPPP